MLQLTVAILTLAVGTQEPDGQETLEAKPPTPVALVRAAAAEGQLAWRLTEPDEVQTILGPPDLQTADDDGGMRLLHYAYSGVHLLFGKFRDQTGPFTLRRVTVQRVSSTLLDWAALLSIPEVIDIGEGQQLVLRSGDDVSKLDGFWGFAGVSLVNCDLTRQAKLVWSMPFDTRTVWPPADRLPEGFNPIRLLKEGTNPGLGVRRLHEQGIDGRGVRIAIVDQPLVPDHREFVDQLERYEEVRVLGVRPQMHGPPVASIAVGKTCGVAPGARLSYYAVPMWKPDNRPYCDVIDKILAENAKLSVEQRIRVVSISTGMFPQQANIDCWRAAKRQAADNGLLIVTCTQDVLRYGRLIRIPGADPDDPAGYRAGAYGAGPGPLLVPAGGRTTASHYGPGVYTYWTEGGLSWATPYIAGVAALACQVNPDITPAQLVELIKQTAVRTAAGQVLNPVAFIEAVRREMD